MPAGVTGGLTQAAGNAQVAFNHIAGLPHSALEKRVARNADFSLLGWAIDPVAKNTGSAVEVAIDGRAYPAEERLPRPDVAAAFSTPAYQDSGFSFSIPALLIGPGRHTFTVRVVSIDGKTYIESLPLEFTVQ
jgi:hypothetical protein